MRRFMMPLICSALILGSAPTNAEDALWKPDDFTGVYVAISDRAENGCWTNIGEARAYAEDQLELAGFTIIDPPTKDTVEPLMTVSNRLTFVVDIKGIRWPDGTCVGSLSLYFVGRVFLLSNQRRWVRSTIGRPASVPMWDDKNFNTMVLDYSKEYIASWVDRGKLNPSSND